MQKTTMVKKEVMDKNRKWYLIDAQGQILGHLAVFIADTLRGKNKPIYTPNVDCGDYVIVINANKVQLSGNKAENEFWYSHSHYMGGLRKRSGKEMINKYSDELITNAVRRMMPKNKLSRKMITKLHVYEGSTHKHEAQNPITVQIS